MTWVVRLAYPYLLVLLIVGLLCVLWLRLRIRRTVLYQYPLAHYLARVTKNSSHPRGWILRLLRFASLLLFALLASKPLIVDPRSHMYVEGIDIVLALDVSNSMSFPSDMRSDRSRLDIAKQEAERFINKRVNDAIGLVLFGNDALSRCPLTTDKQVLRSMMREVELGMVDGQGTVIARGLLNAINRLRYSDAKSKVIVLLTDGEPTEDDIHPEIPIRAAQQLGIKIYTVGIGSEHDMPVHNFGWHSMGLVGGVNKALLQQLARKTGGHFFMAKNAEDMRRIYDEIDSLEKKELEVPVFSRTFDWFLPLAWAAFWLLLVELSLTTWVWFGL